MATSRAHSLPARSPRHGSTNPRQGAAIWDQHKGATPSLFRALVEALLRARIALLRGRVRSAPHGDAGSKARRLQLLITPCCP
jgi:hypothetical protein